MMPSSLKFFVCIWIMGDNLLELMGGMIFEIRVFDLAQGVSVAVPQTGHCCGGLHVPLRVRFSAICGMIMFAL